MDLPFTLARQQAQLMQLHIVNGNYTHMRDANIIDSIDIRSVDNAKVFTIDTYCVTSPSGENDEEEEKETFITPRINSENG